VDQAVGAASRQIVVQRDRVEMTGEDDPLVQAEVGARDHGVAVPEHLQMRVRRQRGLDLVRKLLLGPADRGDVHQRLGQIGSGEGQVQLGHSGFLCRW
jgi:hypothetical protein